MLVVVGGHTRNIGKTSVVAELITNLRDRNWTAVKITQYGHGVCSTHDSGTCGCEAGEESAFALSEEYEPSRTDSGRFLVAGAARSFWLRTPMGELAQAAETVSKIVAQSPNVIIESNSVMEIVHPDLFLMVLDPASEDFKPTSLRFMQRAHAFLLIDRGESVPSWKHLADGLWDGKPQFLVQPPPYVPAPVAQFVKERVR